MESSSKKQSNNSLYPEKITVYFFCPPIFLVAGVCPNMSREIMYNGVIREKLYELPLGSS